MSDTLVETRAPIDNLVRALFTPATAELRADGDGDGRTLFGHFAVFDEWTEINSWYEGNFLERIAPGAFKRTFKERKGQIRVMYDHGHDPSIGDKPLGAPDVLREDETGAYYESELFDAEYVNQLIPALRAGQLGASFRFKVRAEHWNEPAKASKTNPGKLPERTISDVDLYELGPVPWGAYDKATAGVRSGSDQFIERLLRDPLVLARFTERVGGRITEQLLSSLPADGRSTPTATPEVPADGGSKDQVTLSRGQREAWFRDQTLQGVMS